MDLVSILFESLKSIWYVFPILITLALLKTLFVKGVLGELLVNLVLALFLDKNHYRVFKNVTLPIDEGTTQIDHIVVSPFGIFVIETKNMKGWIYGGERQKSWTQKIYRHSSKFQNPLHQNYKHVVALADCLSLPVERLFSVAVFVGDSEFKSAMPDNVTYMRGLIRFIKSKETELFSESDLRSLHTLIESGRLKASIKTHREHVAHVKDIVSNKPNQRTCKKCGSEMILRTTKNGPNTGKQFFGCAQFPKCRSIQSI